MQVYDNSANLNVKIDKNYKSLLNSLKIYIFRQNIYCIKHIVTTNQFTEDIKNQSNGNDKDEHKL